MAEIL